jgi:hypothetical protein
MRQYEALNDHTGHCWRIQPHSAVRANPEVSLVIAMLIEACMLRPRPAWFDIMEAPGSVIVRKQTTIISDSHMVFPISRASSGNNAFSKRTVDAVSPVNTTADVPQSHS